MDTFKEKQMSKPNLEAPGIIDLNISVTTLIKYSMLCCHRKPQVLLPAWSSGMKDRVLLWFWSQVWLRVADDLLDTLIYIYEQWQWLPLLKHFI